MLGARTRRGLRILLGRGDVWFRALCQRPLLAQTGRWLGSLRRSVANVAHGGVSRTATRLQFGANSPNPGLALARDRAPLSQGGRASLAVEISADEVAFLIEKVVDRAVDGSEFLERLHPEKPLHRAFSSSEWLV